MSRIKIINHPPKLAWLLKLRFKEYSFEGGVACAFGNVVYSKDVNMDESFQIHEETHLIRQKRSKLYGVWWWTKYFLSSWFRFEEELIAYQRQFNFIRRNYPRHTHEKWLVRLATQLASPLYGNLVGVKAAEKLITEYETGTL